MDQNAKLEMKHRCREQKAKHGMESIFRYDMKHKCMVEKRKD
jgi:hypothetical protein